MWSSMRLPCASTCAARGLRAQLRVANACCTACWLLFGIVTGLGWGSWCATRRNLKASAWLLLCHASTVGSGCSTCPACIMPWQLHCHATLCHYMDRESTSFGSLYGFAALSQGLSSGCLHNTLTISTCLGEALLLHFHDCSPTSHRAASHLHHNSSGL